ncbi:MAG: transglycosylase SLT domain-containing protein [Steroidobacteraceae bacterium]
MTRAWRILLLSMVFAVTGCGREPAPTPANEAGTGAQPAVGPAPADRSSDAAGGTGAGSQAGTPATPPVRALSVTIKQSKGDFGSMVEQHRIRVLLPYSRSLFFNDHGTVRGIAAENARDFEQYINRKYRKDKRPITVLLVPTPREELIEDVNEGYGDIAIGNLTATEQRRKVVDFVTMPGRTVKEVVVTGPTGPAVASLDDLSGRTVSVRASSSYHESLVALNAALAAKGRKPVVIQLLPDALEDEDALEMLNAGVLTTLVVDDWKADLWAQILPSVRVHDDVVLRDDGHTGWAIRKGSPELAAAIEDYMRNHLEKLGVLDYRLAQYMKRVKQIGNAAGDRDRQKFEQTVELFSKYGAEYGFDPLMLAAQGYQESRLDQQARSRVGAVGVMQLMPATGKELSVGDIRVVEPNIHGGAKYMDQLMTRYFTDAKFDEQNRSLFAFAAYNAGPGRIRQMRELAAQRGLDPDVWFNNVEIVTAEKVGMETTTYVRNIYKYYVTYRLLIEADEARKRALERAQGL